MLPEQDETTGIKPEGTGTTQPPAIEVESSTVAAAPTGSQEERVLQVKHSDFKRIKDEAREKGRREAADSLDAQAKAVGFASHADALKALADLRKMPPAPPARPAAPAPPEGEIKMPDKPKTRDDRVAAREAARLKVESDRLAADRVKMRRQWRAEEMRGRELQQQLDAKEAEMAIREELYRAGVHDVDYGLRLLTRQLEGKTEQEIDAFKRDEFYSGLKKDKPYLFGETVTPATTGTDGAKPGGADPAAPAAGSVAGDAAKALQFDARKAKPDEVQARLKALGLNPHM